MELCASSTLPLVLLQLLMRTIAQSPAPCATCRPLPDSCFRTCPSHIFSELWFTTIKAGETLALNCEIIFGRCLTHAPHCNYHFRWRRLAGCDQPYVKPKPERYELSPDGRTLIIHDVRHTDTGLWACTCAQFPASAPQGDVTGLVDYATWNVETKMVKVIEQTDSSHSRSLICMNSDRSSSTTTEVPCTQSEVCYVGLEWGPCGLREESTLMTRRGCLHVANINVSILASPSQCGWRKVWTCAGAVCWEPFCICASDRCNSREMDAPWRISASSCSSQLTSPKWASPEDDQAIVCAELATADIWWWPILLAIALFLLVLLIVLFVLVCLNKRRKDKNDKNDRIRNILVTGGPSLSKYDKVSNSSGGSGGNSTTREQPTIKAAAKQQSLEYAELSTKKDSGETPVLMLAAPRASIRGNTNQSGRSIPVEVAPPRPPGHRPRPSAQDYNWSQASPTNQQRPTGHRAGATRTPFGYFGLTPEGQFTVDTETAPRDAWTEEKLANFDEVSRSHRESQMTAGSSNGVIDGAAAEGGYLRPNVQMGQGLRTVV